MYDLDIYSVIFQYHRYAAGDYAGQILQQCLDMIRYQPPATNLTVPTSAAYGENITPGAVTGEDREQELWRKQIQVRSAFSADLKLVREEATFSSGARRS